MIILHLLILCLGCMSGVSSHQEYAQQVQQEETKQRKNEINTSNGIGYLASDLLSYQFGYYFYDKISDFESPRTNNITYNSTNDVSYEYISEDSPIGSLGWGGYSTNLLNENISYNNYFIYLGSISLKANTTYTLNLSSSVPGSNVLCGNLNLLNTWSFNKTLTFTPSQDVSGILTLQGTYSNFSNFPTWAMVNYGSNVLPYEKYFTGVLSYGGVSAYSFTINKSKLATSDTNSTCYKYDFSVYGRNPSGRPLLFTLSSWIIPNFKRQDSQGNIYDSGIHIYSELTLGSSFDYPIRAMVYQESTEYSVRPITTAYYDNNVSGDSYNAGYDTGYQNGYNIGNNYGYSRGYSEGIQEATSQESTALTIFTGIIEVGLLPVNVFLKMFEYEVFGINIAGLVSAGMTIAIVAIIIRVITGKKDD